MKYQGERYILFGSYIGGGWDDYAYEFISRREAKLFAWIKLDQGFSATLLDQKTGEQIELTLKDIKSIP